MSPKATVVLASFDTTDREALESLDRQSAHASMFEVVMVNDGTNQRAHERMVQLAANRPNFFVHRVEGAQHLGARRNAGVSVASGEYVLFVDGALQLGDEALERLCQFANDHNADVCFGKTSHKGTRPLGGDLFGSNRPVAAKDTALLEALGAMKIYRRSFLAERALEFSNESDLRIDPAFDLSVLSATDSISVLADYPCFVGDAPLDESDDERYLQSLKGRNGADELRRMVLMSWHRRNLETLIRPGKKRSPEQKRAAAARSSDLVNRHIPADLDTELSSTYRSLSGALRAGDLERVVTLAQDLRTPPFKVQNTRTGWDNGVLDIDFDLRRSQTENDPLGAPDLTDLRLVLVHPSDGVEWQVREQDLTVSSAPDSEDKRLSVRVNANDLAGGRALTNGVWVPHVVMGDADLAYRVRIPFPRQGRSAAFLDGRPLVCFKDGKNLSLDVGAIRRPVVGNLSRQPGSVFEDARGSLLRVVVPDLYLEPGAEMTGQLRIGELPVIATIRAENGMPELRAWVSGLAGSYPLETKFSMAAFAPTGLALVVDGRGGMTVEPSTRRSKPQKKSPAALTSGRRPATTALRSVVKRVPGTQSLYRKIQARRRKASVAVRP